MKKLNHIQQGSSPVIREFGEIFGTYRYLGLMWDEVIQNQNKNYIYEVVPRDIYRLCN